METDDPEGKVRFLGSTENGNPGSESPSEKRTRRPLAFRVRTHSKDDSDLPLTEEVNMNLDGMRRSRSLGTVTQEQMSPEDTESFLIGRREMFKALKNRAHSHVRITEVVPSNSALVCDDSDDSTSWKFPVQVFTDKKRGKSKEDKKLSRRIRSYYKDQDQLIRAFEDIQMDVDDEANRIKLDAQLQLRAERLAKLSFAFNLLLLIAKSVAVGLSASIAIISSLVDSAVDLLSGVIIWWTSRAMKNKNIYHYPGGRSRLEPIAIVILSVIMSLASFQLVVESIQKMVDFSSKSGTIPTVELSVILIAVGTVVIKFGLFLVCHLMGKGSSSVQALALDHRNDVLSNIVAIVCGYLGSQEFISKTGKYEVAYIDPIGAMFISLYILVNWWRTGYDQIKLLTGHTADSTFLSKITWLCLNHHHEIIMIDTVRAFHFGNHFLVEVDIVLPEAMSLKEAHNIGETLQQKLEKFPQVERAFVHLDYETSHHPNEEHKAI